MKEIFIIGDHIISPLGVNSEENFNKITQNQSGIKKHTKESIHSTSFYASLIEEEAVSAIEKEIVQAERYTRLEKLIIYSVQSLIQKNKLILTDKTLMILATTKGNISLVGQESQFSADRIYISVLAQQIQKYFQLKNKVITVSNACISGSLAISIAKDLLQTNDYEDAIVVGADEISRFIFSGFSSFQAVSPNPCKPFDKERAGVTLGEAVASVYLSKQPVEKSIKIEGAASCNDANHISGPSRTGEGLYRSIQSALKQSQSKKIDFVSAHGTATLYNDEMESIALHRSELLEVETNSFKGYYGHTLGASGILETILSIHSIKNNTLIKSLGFQHQGTTQKVNVVRENKQKEVQTFLKIASGFGGCNIATVFSKKTVT